MTRLRAALCVVAGLAAVVVGVALLALTPEAQRLPAGGRATPVLIVVIGWSSVALAGYALRRRPDSPFGVVAGAFGLCVLASGLYIADAPLPFLLSTVADPLVFATFVHLLLCFPTGRLQDAASRVVVRALYAVVAVGGAATVLLDADLDQAGCDGCPANVALLYDAPGLVGPLHDIERALVALLAVAALLVVGRRWRRAGAFERRAYAPLLVAGAVVLALGLASAATQDLGGSAGLQRAAQIVFIASFAGLPAAFLLGLMRSRFFRTATVSRLLERLTAERRTEGLSGALGAALGDPTVEVAHWLAEGDDGAGYVDSSGRQFALPDGDDARVATEVTHLGHRVGVLVHDGALAGDPQLLAAATGATALALVNERLEVELRARVEALRESRARVVAAGDAERRRLGRDLHDGAQQRLVALLIDLQLAHDRVDDDGRELVSSALEHARAAVVELRELAAGIHPAVLSQRGLGAAIETLAARSPVPVELELRLDQRLPERVETAAYFVVAEALTNVAKYARATHARVGVRRERGRAVVEVVDDGVGGARADGGSGLRGLADRVGAVDGTLEVRSPPGLGTIVRARF